MDGESGAVKFVWVQIGLQCKKKKTHFRINIENFAYLGTGDFRLLDHDEGRGDQGSLSDIVNRVVGHGLQKVDRLLHREK